MEGAMRVAIVVLASGVLLLSALPAHADFGAIAYDKVTGKRGWSTHEPTQQRANEAALRACGAGDCRVVMHVGPRRCVAVAGVKGGKVIGASIRPEREAARDAALGDCRRRAAGGDCVIQFSDCNH
jgi:hypothetical protein